MAHHLEGVSHDSVSDFLTRERATSRRIWELAKGIIHDGKESFLILDDSVADKRYSQKIDLVKKQYSGAVHALVRGIDVVNLVHYDSESGFNPIDYRIYAPMQDGKTKQEHASEMVIAAVHEKGIQAPIILMDSFYASVQNFKIFHRMGLLFVSQLKSNRLVSLTKEGGYVHMQDLEWDEKTMIYGISVKLKEVPFRLQLFKVVAPDGDIDWVITNHPEQMTTAVIQKENTIRWKIEEMHRELKQITGIEKCQARKSRAQRNHISYCYAAWFSIKLKARELHTNVYALRNELFSDYLKTVLKQPIIPAFHLAC